MYKCDKCKKFGLSFNRGYSPQDFLVGKRSSKVWIIGINPKGEPEKQDNSKRHELEKYFDDKEKIHLYFNDFKRVSLKLYDLFGKEFGVGHTDIVKCFSNKFPPQGFENSIDSIINNCKPFLIEQLKEMKPQITICNGSPVCRIIKEIIKPIEPKYNQGEQIQTYYYGVLNSHKMAVVLSGFIGRLDNYAKRRLGNEIEKLMTEIHID